MQRRSVIGAMKGLLYTEGSPRCPYDYIMLENRNLDVFDFLHYVFCFQKEKVEWSSQTAKPSEDGSRVCFLEQVITPVYQIVAMEARNNGNGVTSHSAWQNMMISMGSSSGHPLSMIPRPDVGKLIALTISHGHGRRMLLSSCSLRNKAMMIMTKH
ncbi:unnamed protein product [Sphagnum troendelagicum]|uniref:1,3-beta-glucan synthase component FKS1-like domain-containing protein n=1 Tax=Sphagnum troendelagicum TaxID=128251 RepID=A0ABP0UUI2_9BRYO